MTEKTWVEETHALYHQYNTKTAKKSVVIRNRFSMIWQNTVNRQIVNESETSLRLAQSSHILSQHLT